ncbi:sulfite exporter TauE/SafE family protein [Xanthobacter autotrophicus]|uniref:sulfite exporter TauE/SafE family protein n=1 Tax=Xanthobacter autotrophicus TaxID=280 RepID=UPI003729E60B
MIVDPGFYLAAVPATILVGLSKGGFTGLSVLAQPILALAMSPIQAAAILLPVLIVQDVVSLQAYWRRWSVAELRRTLPAAVVGIVVGYLLAASVSDQAVALGIGLLSIAEAGRHVLSKGLSKGLKRPAGEAGPASAAVWSAVSGFVSMIANAGGPPMMIYLLRRPRLSPEQFAATTAAFFSVVNWVKVPFFLALGQITGANLATSAVLLPVAVIATIAGVQLVRRVPADRFFGIIYLILAAVGAKLVHDGLPGF